MDEPIRRRAKTQDMVVAGGGIAGLALALAVKQAHQGAVVSLFDPRTSATARSFRAFAVAAGSRRFLESLGVWQAVVPKAQAINAMVITDSRPGDAPRPVYLDFAGETQLGEPFAHMVREADLRAALLEACEDCGLTVNSTAVTSFHAEPGALGFIAEGAGSRTRLLVAADGARSRLREFAGIATVGWDYGQAGIVATLSHERSHEGRATQHFLPAGPLAVLPLRAEDGSERRFSLVWTERTAEARRLVALPPGEFLAVLEQVIGHEYGALMLDDEPSAHPLRLTLPRRLVAGRFALLGDAARTIHPLAGQGLNLGLRDASSMAELVGNRLSLGLDPGGDDMLDAYQRARRFDGLTMAAATDGLNRLFSSDSIPIRMIRDLGLGLVDRMPRLKELFIRDAAGLAGVVSGPFSGDRRIGGDP